MAATEVELKSPGPPLGTWNFAKTVVSARAAKNVQKNGLASVETLTKSEAVAVFTHDPFCSTNLWARLYRLALQIRRRLKRSLLDRSLHRYF
jgi:hypothetical protein